MYLILFGNQLLVEQLDMPNGIYSGHQPMAAVNNGIIPIAPHQLLK
jgi:hypothetical protein